MNKSNDPSLGISLIPIGVLIVALVAVIVIKGADAVQLMSQMILLGASVVAYLLCRLTTRRRIKVIWSGMVKGMRQVLPSIPILLLIATISATWMLSGVVPTLIDYGLEIISPRLFLLIACAVCAMISVLSGSSWIRAGQPVQLYPELISATSVRRCLTRLYWLHRRAR